MNPLAKPMPNRARIRSLRDDLERRTRQHFATAKQEMQPVLAAFADAYGKELQRLQRLAEDAGRDPAMARVPLHWLTTSGWKLRVQVAMQHAVDTAAQRSLADLKRAQRQAIDAGSQEAQRLLQRALSPGQRLIARQQRRQTTHGR